LQNEKTPKGKQKGVHAAGAAGVPGAKAVRLEMGRGRAYCIPFSVQQCQSCASVAGVLGAAVQPSGSPHSARTPTLTTPWNLLRRSAAHRCPRLATVRSTPPRDGDGRATWPTLILVYGFRCDLCNRSLRRKKTLRLVETRCSVVRSVLFVARRPMACAGQTRYL